MSRRGGGGSETLDAPGVALKTGWRRASRACQALVPIAAGHRAQCARVCARAPPCAVSAIACRVSRRASRCSRQRPSLIVIRACRRAGRGAGGCTLRLFGTCYDLVHRSENHKKITRPALKKREQVVCSRKSRTTRTTTDSARSRAPQASQTESPRDVYREALETGYRTSTSAEPTRRPAGAHVHLLRCTRPQAARAAHVWRPLRVKRSAGRRRLHG